MKNCVSISIIMPVFNPNTNYLQKALDSVLSQTLKNIEIILVDDASTIEYQNYLEQYFRDDRVKLIKLDKNSGSGVARNKGLLAAKGNYIAFLDSDDYYYSDDVLEKLYKIALETSENVVGAVPYDNQNGVVNPIYWSFNNYDNLFRNKVVKTEDYQICFGYWSYIYNKEFILKNKLFFNDLRRFQDPPWFLDVLNAANHYYTADLPFYVHRLTEMINYKWTRQTLGDYFIGLTEIVKKSLSLKYYYLHTYLYRKLIFNEYLILGNAKKSLNLDFFDEFNELLKCFDLNIVKNHDSRLPMLKTVSDFDELNLVDYKNLDY